MTDKQPRNDDNECPSGEHRGDVRAAGPDLKSLRLPSNYGATLGVEKLLTNVTICRPKKTQFFRTHISDEMTFAVMLLDNKEAREYYVVVPEVAQELSGLARPVMLHASIDRQNNPFLNPVPQPGEDGGGNCRGPAAAYGELLRRFLQRRAWHPAAGGAGAQRHG